MRKQMVTCLSGLGVLITLGAGMLTGCTEKNVDYSIDGVREESQTKESSEKSGKSGVAQFKDEEPWEETWTFKAGEMEWEGYVSDVETDAVVKARIIVPETKQMSVIQVAEPEFDAEYKKQIAGRLFEKEEIYYGFTDVRYIPKTELEKRISECEEQLALANKGGVSQTDLEDDTSALEHTKAVYEANLENAKDTYTPVDEYTENEYIGTYQGLLYDLRFEETWADETYPSLCKWIVWAPKDLRDVCPEKFKDETEISCSPWTEGELAENQCEIEKEEAFKKAQRFVEKLGLDYSVSSYTCPLMWGRPPEGCLPADGDEPDDWGVNGYVFSFDLGVDDISFVEFGTEEDYGEFWENAMKDEEKQYSLKSQLQVYVTDKGVIQMVANNPLEITGVSENVALLPLQTIKNIIKKELEAQWEIFRLSEWEKQYFDEMELIYFRVRDKENPGTYSYIPAWRLASVTKDEVLHHIVIQRPVLINAIDGSVIDFYDET